MNTKYDVIIIGAGPAGISCSIMLTKYGKKCLVIERKKQLGGKVCGDGLTSRCLKSLKYLDIDASDLILAGGKKILYNITFYDDVILKKRFIESETCKDYSIGISRDIFDVFLYNKARRLGVQFVFDTTVLSIERVDKNVIINGKYNALEYVDASGVLGRKDDHQMELPVGVSSRIIGDGILKDECFYFFRKAKYADGYAWIFPVGKHEWNIGCWSLQNRKNIKALYLEFEEEVKTKYLNFYSYDRFPRGALLGIGKKVCHDNRIGDAALLSDRYSGEGVSFAVESGINMALKIVHKKTIKFENRTVVDLSEEDMCKYDYIKYLEEKNELISI